MKKVMCVCLVLLPLFGTSACGGNGAKKDTVLLTDQMPGGLWYGLVATMGDSDYSRLPLPLQNEYSVHCRIPDSLQYCTPDTIRAALKGLRAEPLTEEEMQALSDEEAMHFRFTFVNPDGREYCLYFYKNGAISIRSLLGDDLNEQYLQDDGSCYEALREAFGDLADYYAWRIPMEVEGGASD